MFMNSRLFPVVAAVAGLTGLGAGVLTLSSRSESIGPTAVSLTEAAASLKTDDWSDLTAEELAIQFAAAMDASPPPSSESIAAATAHAWTFLGDASFIATCDADLLSDLLTLFVDLFSFDQRETLSTLLLADPGAMAGGDFDNLATMNGVLKNLGVAQSDRVHVAVDWADGNDWSALAVEPLSRLWLWVQDDLGERSDCGVRWSGSIIAPSTGDFTFSQLIESGGTAQNMTVWIDGQLALAPDDSGDGDISTPLPMTQGQVVSILVEFTHANEFIDRVKGYPVAMLFWKTDAMEERELVPSSMLAPPPGFGDGGDGLKGEYFDASILAVSVVERLDPAIDFVWANTVFAPRHNDLQQSIRDTLWNQLLLADFTGQGAADNDGPRAFRRVASGLSSNQKQQVIGWMAASQTLINQMTDRELRDIHNFAKHAPGDEMTSLIGNWCQTHPSANEFGAVNDFSEGSYGDANFLPYWRLANSMSSVPWNRAAELEESYLVAPDGSCHDAVASVLSNAHQLNRTLDTWCAALEAYAADEQIDGDVRADWLLARANAEECRTGSPRPWTGRKWVEAALAESLSPAQRQRVIKDLIIRVAALDHGGEAHSILDSLGNQVGDGNLVAQWHQSIDDVAAVYAQARVVAAAEADAAYLATLQQRLQAAHDVGDQIQIERYQRLLDQVTE